MNTAEYWATPFDERALLHIPDHARAVSIPDYDGGETGQLKEVWSRPARKRRRKAR